MNLSVCMLTRNDAGNLARVLGSLVGLGCEVVIGDTGSTDGTGETATRLLEKEKSKVLSIAWDDDFGAARTQLIQNASAPWVLYLNPDEELLLESRPALRSAIASPSTFAVQVLVREIHNADRPEDFGETIQTRIFRKHPDLRCVGRLHPGFEPSLESLAKASGQVVKPAAIVIRRHAYTSPVTKEKIKWVVRLLERELADRPNQLGYRIELGLNLLQLGDPRGHEILGEAANPVCKQDKPSSPETQRLLEYLIQVKAADRRTQVTAAIARELAEKWFPKSPPMLWNAAQSHYQDKDYAKAAELLERLLELGREGTFDRSESFSNSLFGENTYLNLTACLIQLDKLEQAEPILRQLLDQPTARDQALNQMGILIRRKQARS